MATSTIPSFSKIDSTVTLTSPYGTVRYTKWNHIVLAWLNVTDVQTNTWILIATQLPKPVDSLYMTGLNGASNDDISVNMNTNGELKIYGRGSQSSAIFSFVYLSSE